MQFSRQIKVRKNIFVLSTLILQQQQPSSPTAAPALYQHQHLLLSSISSREARKTARGSMKRRIDSRPATKTENPTLKLRGFQMCIQFSVSGFLKK